jgi:hypothetical protein
MANNLPAAEPYFLKFEQIGAAQTGILVTSQQAANLPFAVKRVFWVLDTPSEMKRGGHANKATEEIMVVLNGAVTVETESRSGRKQTFELNDPAVGLYIPTYCWLSIRFAPGTILLCLASTDFDETDYIQDLADFRSFQQKGSAQP